MPAKNAFIPGLEREGNYPLARFLPRLEKHVIETWLKKHVQPGGLVIDPFGASPQLAIEAAQAGYRVITAVNNPVTRLLLEFSGEAPASEVFQSVISQLAATRVGSERLELHILAGYATTCDQCGAQIYADSFLWQHEDVGPYARIYTCPRCQHSGEFATSQQDIDRAVKFSNSSLHRARALERIASVDSPERKYAEDALDVYLPRALYGLSMLSNKIDGLEIAPEHVRPLQALLISTFEQANSLWRHPAGIRRPKQLSTPAKFRENNIWFALERSVLEWANQANAVQIVQWPKLPPKDGGISIYAGRMKELSGELVEQKLNKVKAINAVVAVFPRPNQAFWTLSALWTGWLWGQEALGEFGKVLMRRRYDWAWHSNALYSSLNSLQKSLPKQTPMFGLVTENEAGFDAAVMIACELAGFELQHSAVRPESGQSQFLWTSSIDRKASKQAINAEEIIRVAATNLLEEYGQPVAYLHLQTAALSALINANQVSNLGLTSNEATTHLRSQLEQVISQGQIFRRFGGGDSSIDSGKWWLAEKTANILSLEDRIEKELVNHLIKFPGQSFVEIEQAMCNLFSHALTPARGMILDVLESYGQENNGRWTLRVSDSPTARKADLQEIKAKLFALGKHLDYEIEAGTSIVWNGKDENKITFFPIASAIIAEIAKNANQASNNYVVLPGSRTNLVINKLSANPLLKLQVETKLSFIKFRHIRRLAENRTITRESIRELLSLDKLQKSDPQIPLL